MNITSSTEIHLALSTLSAFEWQTLMHMFIWFVEVISISDSHLRYQMPLPLDILAKITFFSQNYVLSFQMNCASFVHIAKAHKILLNTFTVLTISKVIGVVSNLYWKIRTHTSMCFNSHVSSHQYICKRFERNKLHQNFSKANNKRFSDVERDHRMKQNAF